MQDKLSNLLYEARIICENRSCTRCEYNDYDRCMQVMQADRLIANDVTVRDKGEWEFQDDGCELLRCSVCGYEYCDLIECKNFCGNCGADMRGDKNEID